MTADLEERLAATSLSEVERRTLKRFVDLMLRAANDDLRGVWLYGSRARGDARRPDSDVDVLVIADGGQQRHGRAAMDLSEEAAITEGESPFSYSVHVYDTKWLQQRREIESFFVREVDRDKVVLAGSALD